MKISGRGIAGCIACGLCLWAAAAVGQGNVRKLLVAQGNDVVAGSPQAFASLIAAEAEKWGALGRKLGVKLD